MKEAGYGPDKRLKVKVSTRNIATFRDPATILIDHLKQVFIMAELEPLETAVWYNRMARKDYSVGMNVQGVGIDDPDVVFYETFSCGSERNYTNYCNPQVEKLLAEQSQEADQSKRSQLVWRIEKILAEEAVRPIILHTVAATCWHPHVKGHVLQQNSIYNNWRFEDVWLDK